MTVFDWDTGFVIAREDGEAGEAMSFEAARAKRREQFEKRCAVHVETFDLQEKVAAAIARAVRPLAGEVPDNEAILITVMSDDDNFKAIRLALSRRGVFDDSELKDDIPF